MALKPERQSTRKFRPIPAAVVGVGRWLGGGGGRTCFSLYSALVVLSKLPLFLSTPKKQPSLHMAYLKAEVHLACARCILSSHRPDYPCT